MRGLAKFVLIAIFAGIVIAVCLFFFEIAKRLLDAIDALGQLVFIVPILVVLFCSCALVIVGTWTLIQRLLLWARTLRPDKHTALYPQVRVDPRHQDRQAWLDLNAQGAQVVAALPRGVKVSPQTLSQVTAPAQAQALPAAPAWPQLGASQVNFQEQHVYDAPIPKEIAVPVGVDAGGRQVSIPLGNSSTFLAGGLPGSGKTNLVAAMVAGLMRGDPTGTRVQVGIIDAKRADFSQVPDNLSGLWRPVARDVDSGVLLINDLWAECERRFKLMEQYGVSNVSDLGRHGVSLPFVFLVVDEWGAFTGNSDFNYAALKLAQLSRAAGITTLYATQRPSRTVVNPDIKAMADATVAFRCRSEADSRVLMDDRAAADLPPIPGRAIVAMGEHKLVHCYGAGVRAGKFGQFMAGLPRVDGPVLSTGIPVYQPISASRDAVPAFRTDQDGPYSPEQVAFIQARYVALGSSLKAVQRELYDGQEGGHWFYAIRDAVRSGGL